MTMNPNAENHISLRFGIDDIDIKEEIPDSSLYTDSTPRNSSGCLKDKEEWNANIEKLFDDDDLSHEVPGDITSLITDLDTPKCEPLENLDNIFPFCKEFQGKNPFGGNCVSDPQKSDNFGLKPASFFPPKPLNLFESASKLLASNISKSNEVSSDNCENLFMKGLMNFEKENFVPGDRSALSSECLQPMQFHSSNLSEEIPLQMMNQSGNKNIQDEMLISFSSCANEQVNSTSQSCKNTINPVKEGYVRNFKDSLLHLASQSSPKTSFWGPTDCVNNKDDCQFPNVEKQHLGKSNFENNLASSNQNHTLQSQITKPLKPCFKPVFKKPKKSTEVMISKPKISEKPTDKSSTNSANCVSMPSIETDNEYSSKIKNFSNNDAKISSAIGRVQQTKTAPIKRTDKQPNSKCIPNSKHQTTKECEDSKPAKFCNVSNKKNVTNDCQLKICIKNFKSKFPSLYSQKRQIGSSIIPKGNEAVTTIQQKLVTTVVKSESLLFNDPFDTVSSDTTMEITTGAGMVVPSTVTTVPSLVTVVPSTVTAVPSTVTVVPSTVTAVPRTETAVPDTVADVPDTVTDVPSPVTAVSSTITAVSNTVTAVSNTVTAVPSSVTEVSNTMTAEPSSVVAIPSALSAVPNISDAYIQSSVKSINEIAGKAPSFQTAEEESLVSGQNINSDASNSAEFATDISLLHSKKSDFSTSMLKTTSDSPASSKCSGLRSLRNSAHSRAKADKSNEENRNVLKRPNRSTKLSKRRKQNDERVSAMKIHLYNLQDKTEFPVWVECDNCKKWRCLKDEIDPASIPSRWTCSLNPDENYSSCDAFEQQFNEDEHDFSFTFNKFTLGSVVWVTSFGPDWWPAMVDDDPDTETFFWLPEHSNVPNYYHVTFFGREVSRAWVRSQCVVRFFPSRIPVVKSKLQSTRKELQKAIGEAKLALTLPLAERRRIYCFATRYEGDWFIDSLPSNTETSD